MCLGEGALSVGAVCVRRGTPQFEGKAARRALRMGSSFGLLLTPVLTLAGTLECEPSDVSKNTNESDDDEGELKEGLPV